MSSSQRQQWGPDTAGACVPCEKVGPLVADDRSCQRYQACSDSLETQCLLHLLCLLSEMLLHFPRPLSFLDTPIHPSKPRAVITPSRRTFRAGHPNHSFLTHLFSSCFSYKFTKRQGTLVLYNVPSSPLASCVTWGMLLNLCSPLISSHSHTQYLVCNTCFLSVFSFKLQCEYLAFTMTDDCSRKEM